MRAPACPVVHPGFRSPDLPAKSAAVPSPLPLTSGGQKIEQVVDQQAPLAPAAFTPKAGVMADPLGSPRAQRRLHVVGILQQPALQIAGQHLHMALQAVGPRPQPEDLLRAEQRGTEQLGRGRQAHPIAMPVQHHLTRIETAQQRLLLRSHGEGHRSPAHLADRHRRLTRAEGLHQPPGGMHQQLGPQAEAHHGMAAFQHVAQQVHFSREPGVGGVADLGHPHRTAQHQQHIADAGIRQRIAPIRAGHPQLPTPGGGRFREQARPLPVEVLDGEQAGHGRQLLVPILPPGDHALTMHASVPLAARPRCMDQPQLRPAAAGWSEPPDLPCFVFTATVSACWPPSPPTGPRAN
ncbi:protein of unknown function [Cyanobium sp. NIES-981]|nr:protein of unknown function [Cyanobium sp. NIES-981]